MICVKTKQWIAAAASWFAAMFIGAQAFADYPIGGGCDFGIYTSEETNIRNNVHVSGARIGSDGRVEVQGLTVVEESLQAKGDIFVASQGKVYGDAIAGGTVTAQSGAEITGNVVNGATFYSVAPVSRRIPYGGTNIFLNDGESRTLTPGAYGDVYAYKDVSLTFTAGVYNLHGLIAEADNVRIYFDTSGGAIEINIETDVRFGDRNALVITGGGTPLDVQLYTNATGQVRIGEDTSFSGSILAPRAELWVANRVTFEGQLLAKRLWVDTESVVDLISSCGSDGDTDTDIDGDSDADSDGDSDGDTDTEGGDTDTGRAYDPERDIPDWTRDGIIETEEECMWPLVVAGTAIIEDEDGNLIEIITDVGEISIPSGHERCEVRYCREEMDADGNIIEIEVPDPWLATTPGCPERGSVVDESVCPMILDKNGDRVPADCGGEPSTPAVPIPNDAYDACMADPTVEVPEVLTKSEFCAMDSQECLTIHHCAEDNGPAVTTPELIINEADDVAENIISEEEQFDDVHANLLSTETSVHPCIWQDNVEESGVGTAGYAVAGGENHMWTRKDGVEKWNAEVRAGYTRNSVQLQGPFSDTATYFLGNNAFFETDVTAAGHTFEKIVDLNAQNLADVCRYDSSFNILVQGKTPDLNHEITYDGPPYFDIHFGVENQIDGPFDGNVVTPVSETLECYSQRSALRQQEKNVNTLRWEAEIAREYWNRHPDATLGDRDFAQSVVERYSDAVADYKNQRKYYLEKQRELLERQIEVVGGEIYFEISSEEIGNELNIGPFSIGYNAKVAGRSYFRLAFFNEANYQDEPDVEGLPMLRNVLATTGLVPGSRIYGYAFLSVGLDLRFVKAKAGIEGELILADMDLPISTGYSLELTKEFGSRDVNGDGVADLHTYPSFTHWEAPWKRLVKLRLRALDGYLKAWASAKFFKWTKSWSKKLVSFLGLEREWILDGNQDNRTSATCFDNDGVIPAANGELALKDDHICEKSGETAFGRTAGMVALPVIEILSIEDPLAPAPLLENGMRLSTLKTHYEKVQDAGPWHCDLPSSDYPLSHCTCNMVP